MYERLSSRRTLLLMAAAAIAAAALTIGIAGLLPSADPPEYPTVFFPIPAPPETRLEQVSISPDGKRFAFIAESARGVTEIWVRDLTGRETRKLKGTEGARDLFWSPDSRFVGYFTAENVWKVDAETGDAVKVAVSPDGRWMAYVSDENGQWDVYVASFPDGERRWRISTASGNQPRWNPRGGELFFLSSDRRMMSVRTRSESDTFLWDAPQVLFQTAIVDLGPHRGCWAYAITPDGESFIILTRQVQSESPAVAVLNWR